MKLSRLLTQRMLHKNEKIYKIVFETCFKAKKMVSAYEMNGIFDYTIKWRDKRNE